MACGDLSEARSQFCLMSHAQKKYAFAQISAKERRSKVASNGRYTDKTDRNNVREPGRESWLCVDMSEVTYTNHNSNNPTSIEY